MTVTFDPDAERLFPLADMTDEQDLLARAFRFNQPPFPGDDDPDIAEDEPVIPEPEAFEFHEVRDERGRPVRMPAEIELEADDARTHLAPRPQKGQIKTPDELVDDLEWAKHYAAKSAVIIRDAERTLKALRRLYDRRFSVVVKRSRAKSSDERRQDTDLILGGLVAAMDDAEVVFEYSKRVAKSVETTTSAIQTQARMVDTTYRLAGTGRES